MTARISWLVRELFWDERGQDLLEYALLSAFIGLAGLAALNGIGVSLNTYYGTSNSSVNGLWNSPTPTGS